MTRFWNVVLGVCIWEVLGYVSKYLSNIHRCDNSFHSWQCQSHPKLFFILGWFFQESVSPAATVYSHFKSLRWRKKIWNPVVLTFFFKLVRNIWKQNYRYRWKWNMYILQMKNKKQQQGLNNILLKILFLKRW